MSTVENIKNLAFLLFILGTLTAALSRSNAFFLLVALEMGLLGVTLNFLASSLYLSNVAGQAAALIVLTLAACDSVIGLGLLVLAFRVRGSIHFTKFCSLRG